MQCVQLHTRCEIYPLVDSCVIIVHGGHAFPMCNLSVDRDSARTQSHKLLSEYKTHSYTCTYTHNVDRDLQCVSKLAKGLDAIANGVSHMKLWGFWTKWF